VVPDKHKSTAVILLSVYYLVYIYSMFSSSI